MSPVALASLTDSFRSLTCCTIDLCLDEKGEVRLVEMNPLRNFGLYAMDYRRILPAIIRHAEIQGPDPVPEMIIQPEILQSADWLDA